MQCPDYGVIRQQKRKNDSVHHPEIVHGDQKFLRRSMPE
jgi:hypothetical protein